MHTYANTNRTNRWTRVGNVPPLLFPFLGCKIASTLALRKMFLFGDLERISSTCSRVYRVNCKTKVDEEEGISDGRGGFFDRSFVTSSSVRVSKSLVDHRGRWSGIVKWKIEKASVFLFSFAIISIIFESLSRLLMDVKLELLLSARIFARIEQFSLHNSILLLRKIRYFLFLELNSSNL